MAKKTRIPDLDRIVCEFNSFQQWVNKASSWIGGYKHSQIICLDMKGRVCECGADMMRADKDNSFPVTVYRTKN